MMELEEIFCFIHHHFFSLHGDVFVVLDESSHAVYLVGRTND
jgi:hypothetical protein